MRANRSEAIQQQWQHKVYWPDFAGVGVGHTTVAMTTTRSDKPAKRRHVPVCTSATATQAAAHHTGTTEEEKIAATSANTSSITAACSHMPVPDTQSSMPTSRPTDERCSKVELTYALSRCRSVWLFDPDGLPLFTHCFLQHRVLQDHSFVVSRTSRLPCYVLFCSALPLSSRYTLRS